VSKPTIPEVIDQFCAYHAKNLTWGSLHIVLDDGNTEDSHVAWCREYALERGDAEGAALAEILLRMSQTQRSKISRLAEKRLPW
jgi:hypothetical protein